MLFRQSLRRLGGAAIAAACVLAFSTAASAKIDDFPGKWVNVDAHTDNLTKVHIDMTGPMSVDVHGWGQCHPSDCDWGTVHGEFIPGAVHNRSFRTLFGKCLASGYLLAASDMAGVRPTAIGRVCVVTAGTSDLPVAASAT